MAEMVFGPLGMTNVGYGGLGTPGQLDQPWGHYDDGRPAPLNGPSADNAAVISPAGRVHCTLADWSKFVADHLRGALGKSSLLRHETYKRLHASAFGGPHALGWIVQERDWGGGTVLNHGGCNGMYFANVWVAPKKDFAVLICTNQGGDKAFEATDKVAASLIELHRMMNR